jgi:multicomponent Na+:H+ antiporter subunit G
VIRLPDVFMRMHATTKAGTLGAGMILLSVAFVFGTVPVVARSIAIIVFIVLTAPVAAHLMGRSAYISRVPMWSRTFIDELRGKYDNQTVEGQAGSKPPPRA